MYEDSEQAVRKSLTNPSVCTHLEGHIHACTHTHTHTYICLEMCTRTHIQIHTHMHTHSQMHTHVSPLTTQKKMTENKRVFPDPSLCFAAPYYPVSTVDHLFPGTWYLTEVDSMYRRKYERKPLVPASAAGADVDFSMAEVRRACLVWSV